MVVGEVDVLFCFLIRSSAALCWRRGKNRKGDCEFRGVYYRKKEKKNQPQTTHGLSACRAGQERVRLPSGHPLTGTNMTMLLPFNKI